jgi:8-amino-7-oxononanoate synthase
VPHHDADAFDTRLRQWRKACGHGRAWIAVESLYSMDGDSPDLTDLLAVASRQDAALLRRSRAATMSSHLRQGAWARREGFVLAPKIVRDFLLSGQPGVARLRVALIASLSEAMIADLFDVMADELRRLA